MRRDCSIPVAGGAGGVRAGETQRGYPVRLSSRNAKLAFLRSGLRRRLENFKAASLAQLQQLYRSLASAAARQNLPFAEAARGVAASPPTRVKPTFVPPAGPRSCWACLGKGSPAGFPVFLERRRQPCLPSPSFPRRQRIVTRAEFTCLATGGLWLHEKTPPSPPRNARKAASFTPAPPSPPACV